MHVRCRSCSARACPRPVDGGGACVAFDWRLGLAASLWPVPVAVRHRRFVASRAARLQTVAARRRNAAALPCSPTASRSTWTANRRRSARPNQERRLPCGRWAGSVDAFERAEVASELTDGRGRCVSTQAVLQAWASRHGHSGGRGARWPLVQVRPARRYFGFLLVVTRRVRPREPSCLQSSRRAHRHARVTCHAMRAHRRPGQHALHGEALSEFRAPAAHDLVFRRACRFPTRTARPCSMM